ncbi:MAG: hypothetical protein M5U34_39450 [Chloroflexi bacterium]|nr:hypothetical protein [Chloroflexota bacterium]
MLRILILRFLESYFNHRWLYLLPTLMMVVAAGLYYFLTVPIYNAKGVFFCAGRIDLNVDHLLT